MLTAAAMVASPSIAQAAVSAPSGLSPNGANQADVPTLQWNNVRSAIKYNVQVSTSPDFSSAALDSASTYNHRYVPKVALPPTTIYWRVQTVSSSGTVSTWSTASFDRDPLAAPSPQGPADGAVLEQPADPPVLTWSPLANADHYEVLIDDDPGFTSPTTDTTWTTSYLVPDPQPATTFFWKVRAVLGTGVNTDWSLARSYQVGGLNEVVPELPVEQDAVEDIVFDWKPVPGAKDYELRISTDQDFNTLVPSAGKTIIVKSTRYSPPETLDNDEYWWQVRARDNNTNAIAWDAVNDAGERRVPVRHFQRHWPEVPSLQYPMNSETQTVGDPFYFQWSGVPHASDYELQVGSDQAFSPGTFSICSTHATTYTPGFDGPGSVTDKCQPVPGNTYYWRVRAYDDPGDVISEWSQIRAFVYDPGMVQLSSPADGASVSLPILRWNALQGAEKYHVELYSNVSGTPVDQADTYSTSWTPTPNAPLDPAKSPYRWKVSGIAHNGDETMVPIPSAQRRFTLVDAPAPSGAGLTAFDVPSPTTDFPTLRWQPLPGAEYYKVLISTHGADRGTYLKTSSSTLAGDQKFFYPSATDVTTSWLSPGQYDFKVEAYDSNNVPMGLSPSPGTFTITPLQAASGQKVALTGTSLTDNACDARLDATTGPTQCDDLLQTPVLDWDPVPGAGSYMIYLFKDDRLTNAVYPRSTFQPMAHLVTTQNTRWTPRDLLADNQAGDGYYWFIRPCKAPTVCAADPTAASNTFDKSSLPVDVSDVRNVVSTDNEIKLYWRDNLENNQDAANGQFLNASGSVETNATVEAQQYRVQISDDPAFATLLEPSVLVDQTTYSPYAKTLPEGPIYWRVQAIDGSDNSLTWSPTQTIQKQAPLVAQRTPAVSAVVNGTPYFRWAPQDFAGSYKLEVYKNGDTTASSTNRVLSATTKQAAYTPTQPFPTSSLPYLWRVQRLDADGKPSRWTDLRPFKVTGQAPAMTFPRSSSYVSADDSLFSWEPVLGATSYKFERRTDGAAYSTETVTTRALSWAPTSLLKDGRYQWRVSSMDSAGKTIASSAWSNFAVDGTAPEVTKKLPGRTTRRDSNWTVTFSEPVKRVNSTTMRLYRANRRAPLAARITSSNGGKTWTLNPSSLMSRGVRYTLKLSAGVTDQASNAVAATSYSRTPR